MNSCIVLAKVNKFNVVDIDAPWLASVSMTVIRKANICTQCVRASQWYVTGVYSLHCHCVWITNALYWREPREI